jgi:ABC-type transporter Mla subunit MlaD
MAKEPALTKEERTQLREALKNVRDTASSIRNLLRITEKELPAYRKVLSEKAAVLREYAEEVDTILSGEQTE